MKNSVSSKKRALNEFKNEIRKRLGRLILGIYLFGSVAKDTFKAESDIDVLIVYSGIDERTLLETASEITFDLACRYGELIEVVSMSKEEYDRSLGSSPFLWEVLEFGIPLYTTLKGTKWELDFKGYLDLGTEFLGYAKDAMEEGKLRLSIDAGYNAAELLVKALIINEREPLSSSHGGIVGQFGRLFVLTGELDRRTGRDLNLSLDLRGQARYKPDASLGSTDAETVIALAEKLLQFARKRLAKRDREPCNRNQ